MRNPLRASSRYGVRLAVAIGFLMAAAAPAHAEDLKNRWYFGGNISFLSTTDDIRSNSAIIKGEWGDDGIPFTGDPNEDQGCLDTSIGGTGPYCDPRPDDLLGRENTIEETLKLEVNAGYGLTSWLSLQFDAGYFKGDVGPIDSFVRQPFLGTNLGQLSNTPAFVGLEEDVIAIQAGEITEIPVALSAVVRFRKDSPLNPYFMVGGGVIFAEMDVSDDVPALNSRIQAAHIKGIFTETNRNITPSQFAGATVGNGAIPNLWPVTVNVKDALEWHLGGGAEYFLNDRMSLVFDARYMFADQAVEISVGGQDQINFLIYSENLYRASSPESVKFFNNGANAPNTLCVDTVQLDPNGQPVVRGVGCGNNPDPQVLGTRRVKCEINDTSTTDFDADGHGAVAGEMDPDICYNANLYNQPGSQSNRPEGVIVVQGGKIDLNGLSVAVGMRFHW